MSVTLKKVTNVGIKITDSVSIPIIKAVIETNGSATDSEMYSLFSEIYSQSVGMVSVCAMFVAQKILSDIESISGTHSIGDDSGFRYQFSCETRQYTATNFFTIVSGNKLYFKGNLVCNFGVLTGYSNWENVCGIIFVDNNNNIYNITGNSGLYMLGADDPGYTIGPGPVISSVVNGDLRLKEQIGVGGDFTLLESISKYITGEIDPGITDPYAGGGFSGHGGGGGSFEDTTTPIGVPGLPGLSAADTGFITLYNPTTAQIKSLSNYMWNNDLFDLDTWKKIFQSPIEAIIGLSIVPVNVPSGNSQTVKIGNIDTGITMLLASSQYTQIDCGSIEIPKYFGSFLDYDPYTEVEIFLPYIGFRSIEANDIVGKTVGVKYNVDVLSGAVAAFITVNGDVFYEYGGNCAVEVPITQNSFTSLISSVTQAIGGVANAVTGAAAGSPAAVIGGVSQIASAALNATVKHVERGGSIGGSPGQLGNQTPFLVISRARQAIAERQNVYGGYPAFITSLLGDLSGYTEVYKIHLEDVPATGDELTEIAQLLTEGVIL